MARRQLLTDEQWARLLAPPSDEREIVRYWTLSREDFDIIFRKRSDHSRLGFALLLCYLRYPGRVLGAEEVPPVALVSFVARQLGVSPAAFIRYSRRDQTRREQLVELMERLSYRSFDRASFLHYLAWLTPIAQNVQRPDLLVEMLLEDLRRHRVLIPTLRMLELLLHQARSRAERLLYRALTNRLTDTQGDALDTLLNQKPEAATSWMGWFATATAGADCAQHPRSDRASTIRSRARH
jgi:TnpA family transposase